MTAAIRLEHLTKDYGRLRALDDVSLEVAPGEIVGFLGPNGSGKSTAIRVVLDLIRATAGRASILGHDCERDGLAARSHLGYLAGDVRLPPRLTGVALITRLAALGSRRVDPARLEMLARRLGADLHRRTGQLSKGNRQAVALVAALATDPPVLVLDEPTGGLDPIRQHELLAILGEVAAAGTAVFFSSHVLSEVEHVCDRVAVLRAGRLIAVDSVAHIVGAARQRIEVTFADDAPGAALDVPGVRELTRTGRVAVFEVTGDADAFVKALAGHRVARLRPIQTGLDEAVRHLYCDGAA